MKKKKTKRGERKRMENAERKIRLGYLSSDFGMGRTRDLLPAFFAAYNKLRFEIYAYHTGMGGDTALFSKEVTLRELGGAAPAEAAEIIRRDKIDLLVDLSLQMPDENLCHYGDASRCACDLTRRQLPTGASGSTAHG